MKHHAVAPIIKGFLSLREAKKSAAEEFFYRATIVSDECY